MTLSVLENRTRYFLTCGFPTGLQEVLNPPRRILLVGCAQTAEVGDPMLVVGVLFPQCSCACEGADPSLAPNLKGLLLVGLAPRARGKHVTWLLSWLPGAPNFSIADILEVPVAPDKVSHHLLRVRGCRLEKTLTF